MQLSNIFPLRKNAIKQFEKIGVTDPIYLKALGDFKLGEIFPDVSLFDYEAAIRRNLSFANDYPDGAKDYWVFGETGQGDLWLLGRNSECVAWFDHNQGEFQEGKVLDFGLSFEDFLKLAFVIREAEANLDSNEAHFDDPGSRANYEAALNGIRSGLFDVYPYKYY